jgi:hypothetical protein
VEPLYWNFPEVSLPVTADTKRNDVIELVSIRFVLVDCLDERADRPDVMHIGIATDLSVDFPTDSTLVFVSFQRLLAYCSPFFAVGLVAAAFPVRMARTSEDL